MMPFDLLIYSGCCNHQHVLLQFGFLNNLRRRGHAETWKSKVQIWQLSLPMLLRT
jgi:hypothetical protein